MTCAIGFISSSCKAEIKVYFFKLAKGQKGMIQLKHNRKSSSHQKKRERKIPGKNTQWERIPFKSKARRTDLNMLWLLSHLFPVYFCLLCFATCSRPLIFSNLNKELWFVLSNNFTHSRCFCKNTYSENPFCFSKESILQTITETKQRYFVLPIHTVAQNDCTAQRCFYFY